MQCWAVCESRRLQLGCLVMMATLPLSAPESMTRLLFAMLAALSKGVFTLLVSWGGERLDRLDYDLHDRSCLNFRLATYLRKTKGCQTSARLAASAPRWSRLL